MLRSKWRTALLGLAVASCTSATPGARPHDMSTARHEQQEAAHVREAEQHAAQYDPDATSARERCRLPVRSAVLNDVGLGYSCWTSLTNPTDTHRIQAEEHRRRAADHRAASAALREAEARACGGIALEERDMSPFEHTEDITRVEPLITPLGDAPTAPLPERTVGAVVTFRAVPGMTAEWLKRLVDCHLARNASLGHVVPEMPNCPLVPNGAQARVKSTGDGFAVEISSRNPATAREILSRAQRLRSTPLSAAPPTM